ncbi:hypothetical protein [Shewanella colwelliana]|uniref:hypothetical protein n=1 Tax=Shewanella colwelliana TaxID=23 RepID=UPI0022AF7C06|nr:hypothetical protein [Shewanella colwelliana]MCZ4339408.1 hypothetical protein [Shewanella colwelliana]
MKLYFLVEGVSSEMAAYPVWIKTILPMLDRYSSYNDFKATDKGFYIISGRGYPSILNHIENAVENIIDSSDVNHFFVILDADEDSIQVRETEVNEQISKHNLPAHTQVHVIVQNRCFETILLANRKAIPRQATSVPLVEYKRYYDVVQLDPEIMGPYDTNRFTHSQFHSEYALKALREKRIRYSKSNPASISNEDFLKEIIKRTNETNHLDSFKNFVRKLTEIKIDLETVQA